MLTTKLFNKNDDYPIIIEFCNAWKLPLIDIELLSDIGVIIFESEKPLVCGWLYPTVGSKLCIIENVIRDKNFTNKELIDSSMSLLFETLHLIALDRGCKYIKNSVQNESMKNRLESYGYKMLETNVTTYMGVL